MKEAKTYTLFDPKTGLPLGRFKCAEDQVAGNVRNNQVAHEGAFDLYATCLDVATQLPVDYQPPRPDVDHEWNADRRRWQKKADIADRDQRRAEAQTRIDALELKQARRVRELLAASDPRLQAIDDEIVSLRRDLNE
ncbi:MAG TPA: hypothetical protein VGN07_23815 [Steroidobacteraceae bacterium]|jgi:hypothetical protein